MKNIKTIIFGFVLSFSFLGWFFTAFAQGTILFDNRVSGVVDVKFTHPELPSEPIPTGWIGQLFQVDFEGTRITPLYPTTRFGVGPSISSLGYVTPTIVAVTDRPPGSEVQILVGAFNTPNYLDATACVSSEVFTVKLGGGADPPAYLVGLSRARLGGPLCGNIPEPGVVSLVLAGAGVLWLVRCRAG